MSTQLHHGTALPTVQAKNGSNNKATSSRMRPFLVVVAITLLWGRITLDQTLDGVQSSLKSWETTTRDIIKATTSTATREAVAAATATEELAARSLSSPPPNNPAANAATGTRFPGTKVRDFPGQRHKTSSSGLRTSHPPESALGKFLSQQPLKNCDKWAVVTTIYEPSDAVLRMGNDFEDWCMVVVADTKTPITYMKDAGWAEQQRKVVFLSVDDQKELAQLVPFVEQTPFRSFARKNIGYLYAVWMGAKVIFDFDDDNLVRTNATDPATMVSGTELLQTFSNLTSSGNSNGHNNIMVTHVSISDDYKAKGFNPFPMMGASLPDTWPRGLPLSLINDKMSRGMPGPLMLQELSLDNNVAVIQSTCDHDPDVDAIYRLTRPLPFTFDTSNTKPTVLQVPPHLYAPYNAQATLHYPKAYWGLYLPMTVTGRVSDIWRSYIVQRLLKELQQDAYLLYSQPLVTQYRNAHDYVGDFVAEGHLYHRTEALLDFLDEWKPSSASSTFSSSSEDNLQARIEDLWIQLYERQYVEMEDVEAVQEWLSALAQGGYAFPAVRDHTKNTTPDVSQGGVEARQECARQRLLQWEEPIPTMMNGSNYGALTFENAANLSLARLLAEYEAEHPFPHSIDLLCRAGGRHAPHELAVLVESIQLYWPKCAGRVVLVLDRGDEEFARENIPSWIDVMFSEFAYNMPGRLGNQLFNMYSDQQGRSEYVAIIDSDTTLSTPITPDLIFNMDKKDERGNFPPYVLVDTQYQKGMWSTGDEWMFKGDSNDWTFMVTLPLVFPRAMFPQYRAGVEAIHNNEFETTDLWNHFRTTVRMGWMGMSQFSLLGNWMVKHWTDRPFDLRNETDAPSIRYGVHLPYEKGIDFSPGGRKDPPSFQAAGRRAIRDGLCELFCSPGDATQQTGEQTQRTLKAGRAPLTLQSCGPSLCPYPIEQPRNTYFKYERYLYGTPKQRSQVCYRHFQPFRTALATLFEKHRKRRL